MKNKPFDCVEMKRKGALRIHKELKDKTFEEKVEYWRQANKEFHRTLEARRKRSPPGQSSVLNTEISSENADEKNR